MFSSQVSDPLASFEFSLWLGLQKSNAHPQVSLRNWYPGSTGRGASSCSLFGPWWRNVDICDGSDENGFSLLNALEQTVCWSWWPGSLALWTSRSHPVSLNPFYLAFTSVMILLTALHLDSQPNFLREAKYKVHLSFQVSLFGFETHRLSAISVLRAVCLTYINLICNGKW